MLYGIALILILAAIVFWHVELLLWLTAGWLFIVHLFFPLWNFIRLHPWQTVMYVTGYFLLGAVYSVIKWYLTETNRVRMAREELVEHNRRHQDQNMSWADWAQFRKTDPAVYKHRILWWIALWPFSGLETIFGDLITRVCRRIYEELQGVYQRITDFVWKEGV